MFVYYWIPGVLFQGLSVFSFVTWIRPNNVVLNQLFGGFTGLSLIPLTFDWVSHFILFFSYHHTHAGFCVNLYLLVKFKTSGEQCYLQHFVVTGALKLGTTQKSPAMERNTKPRRRV